jgi:cytoskeleton protein RodZ
MSSTLFGEHLKREREMRGVSLEEIAAATRINTRYLEALEKAHWSDLPGGAFNRGFIRSVARFLGLDEDGLIAEYSLETNEKTAASRQPAEMPRDWKPLLIAISLLILIILAGFLGYKGYRIYRARRAERLSEPSSALIGFPARESFSSASPSPTRALSSGAAH